MKPYIAGRLAPLSECRILNMSLPSIKVGCQEVFAQGLPQTILLRAYENEKIFKGDSNSVTKTEIEIINFDNSLTTFSDEQPNCNCGLVELE